MPLVELPPLEFDFSLVVDFGFRLIVAGGGAASSSSLSESKFLNTQFVTVCSCYQNFGEAK